MEGRLLEESGWYCGSSDDRGSSERCCTRSEAGGVLGGLASYELRLGLFYTQQAVFIFAVDSYGCRRLLLHLKFFQVG